MNKRKFIILIFLMVLFSACDNTQKSQPQAVKSNFSREADKALKNEDLIKARQLYKDSMEDIKDPEQLMSVQKKIEDLNIRIMFSEIVDECSQIYTVKPGDALVKIAARFKTTVGLIKRTNKLTSNKIVPGQKLKVNTCEFSVVVDKSQNVLFLKRSGEVIKKYVVSTGSNNSTPVGQFAVTSNKIENPTWYKTGAIIPPDSPENILGTRWIGLDIKGYGIHGTTMPQDLGKQATLGCVRMLNDEVEELFDIIPVGTSVTIVD